MKPPLFLLAPPRSYTSIINAMIGQHPEAYGLPELNLFFYNTLLELWNPDSKEVPFDKKSTHGMLRTVAEIFTGEQTDRSIECAEHWCAARQNVPVGEVFNDIRRQLDPLIPVDKSPWYTLDIEFLIRIIESCPDAKFIHLTRHPIKQCESNLSYVDATIVKIMNSVDYTKDKAILEPQMIWHDMNINILNFLENYVPKNQYIRMRGEEVMENTEAELVKMCRWLGIRDDAEAIDEMMHPERSSFANFGPLTALFGNDTNFLKGSKFKKHKPELPDLDSKLPWRDDEGLKPQVKELAREFGY
ncbi:MAG: sulfotransferase family protein [Alphaproteobacteria bacterium CG11_big_fil_rev_8_21_14_0_20_39_49]|nr:MAG: sulfotransferase family protein [Alphaproteobacteria bacterium CG11_big_fil_rev_8_21_14_0_20_39_49]